MGESTQFLKFPPRDVAQKSLTQQGFQTDRFSHLNTTFKVLHYGRC